jgi:polysaccharide biosynthesis/export protein
MISMGRAIRLGFFAVLLGALPVMAAHAQANVGSSTTDVMQVFRSMTPEQQQQVMQQLGISQGSTGNAFGVAGVQGQGEQAARQADLEALRLRRQREQEEKLEERLPILHPQDWVVVEVSPRPLPPRPTETPQSLYRSLTAGTGMGSSSSSSESAPNSGQQNGQPPQQLSPAQMQQLQQFLQEQDTSGPQNENGPSGGSQGNQGGQQPNPLAPEQLGQQVYQQGWQNGPPNLLQQPDPRVLAQLAALIRSKNPYQLDREGVLVLPGFAGIRLDGLSDVQATLRLEVEPSLRGLHFRITKLPLAKSGFEGLKPFGYDLFDNPPSTFAPVTNVPVPADYVLGPGDQLQVQLYGNQNRSFTLAVGRDGRVNFPELGPISVAGMRFMNAKDDLEARVARQMIGVKADVSMGETRAIRVFVLGEAQDPGTYAVSGLATMTSALYAAGGIKRIGSLRDIQLKRQGQVIKHLDLYDLLIRGDTTDDARLLPGDAIFIPPVGHTVSVEGEVHRPAIYEIKREGTVGDLLQLAGGLTPEAESSVAWLTRIEDPNLQRIVLRVDLTSAAGRNMPLRNGDMLRVTRLRPTLDSGIVLQGHIYTPGTVAYRPGMRLTDVIQSVQELQPNADLHYVLVRRELPPDRRIVAFSVDLGAALAAPGSSADITLMPRDRVIVFDLESGRDRIIQPLLEELRLQARFDRPEAVVKVQGRVKVPGEYPLEPGMRVSDLLRAGGNLSDAAYGGEAELARYTVVNGEERQTQLIPIDLAAVLRGDPKANIQLQPFDSLSVKQLSLWGDQQQVTLLGQVRFPGIYTIKEGETLKSVLLRAGGLTEFAFPEGSIFTRVELKQREQQELDMLAQRTQTDIAAMALQATAAGTVNGQGASGTNALAVGQSLLTQLRATRAVGRLVIDVPRLMRERVGSEDDVIMRNGDQLIVPKYEQEVTVIGEVQSATSHLYRPGLTREDYIAQSGGMTRRADSRKIYVVRANGSVVSAESNYWFFRAGARSMAIHPGDTIVVPMNTEKLPPLPEWQAITTIIYNLAIGVAAMHSVGAL